MTSTWDPPAPAAEAEPATKFPSKPYRYAHSFGDAYFSETARAAASIDPVQVDGAAALLLDAYVRGASVFSCGNGGSAAIANHLQCDHLKGVRTGTDLLPRIMSLSTNLELITAVANDISYEDVFAYQLQSQSQPGDVLVAISSSGNSPNIVRALEWARGHRMRTIVMTGFTGGRARLLADASIHVQSSNYGIVEDLHQAAMHFMAQYIRQSRMAPGAVASTTF